MRRSAGIFADACKRLCRWSVCNRIRRDRSVLSSTAKSCLGAVRCRRKWRAIPIKKSLYLSSNGFFVRRAKHAGGVDSVLLSELASSCVDSTLVENLLHRLEYVLRVRCRRGIRVLLATHNYFHNLA